MARARGRLSTVDLLPAEAEEDVQWAYAELKKRKRLQTDILDQFNLRLKMKGLGPISKSAFNRASIRTMRMATRLEETREIASVLAVKLDTHDGEDLALLLGETIKTLVYEMLENAGPLKANGFSAEMMMNFARSVKMIEETRRVVTTNRKVTDELIAEKAGKAIDEVAKREGLSRDTVESIKAKILGVEKR